MATVAGNVIGYTKGEVERAKEALKLIKRLGFCSNNEAMRMLNLGNLLDVNLTSSDVDRARVIYGPMIGREKGFMTDLGPVGLIRHEHSLVMRENQVGHTDVGHFFGESYLITVFKPINMIVTTLVGKEHYNGEDLKPCIETQLSLMELKGLNVTSLESDRDPVLASLGNVKQVEFSMTGGGTHEGVAERTIRLLKDKIRAILSNLPYDLPSSLQRWIVFYATTMTNVINRSSSIGVSAYEAYHGKKLNYKKDLKLEFGEYALVYRPAKQKNSLLHERCSGCICLGPTLNNRGTQIFFNIQSKRVIHSDNYKLAPMPDEVIEVLDNMAIQDNKELIETDDADDDYSTETLSDGEDDDDYSDIEEDELKDLQNDLFLEGETSEGGPEDIPVPVPSELSIEQGRAAVVNTTLSIDNEDNSAFAYLSTSSNAFTLDLTEHLSIAEGLEIGGEIALKGIHKELRSFMDRETGEPIKFEHIEDKKKIVPAGFLLKPKMKQGELIFKGRLIAYGNRQQDTEKMVVYAATVNTANILTGLAWNAHLKNHLLHMDIETAFLECFMKPEDIVYLKVSKLVTDIMIELYPSLKEFADNKGNIYFRLRKALYGLKQSPKLWYDHLTTKIKDLGYRMNSEDQCVFSKVVNGSTLDVFVYVDDILMSHNNKEILELEAQMLGKQFSGYNIVHDNESMKYVGLEIRRNKNMDIIVSMNEYVENLIKWSGCTKQFSTPGEPNDFQSDESEFVVSMKDIEIFHTGVAKLLFVAKRVRPDILLQVNMLCSKVKAPRVKNLRQLQRIYGYLLGTPRRGIVFEGGGKMLVKAWGDAAFMLHEDLTSRSASLIVINGGVVEAHTSKESMRVRSAAEAEFVQASRTVDYTMAGIRFLREQGWMIEKVPVFQDNKAVLALVAAGKPTSNRTKHIALRHFALKELVDSNDIVLVWVSTKSMLADILTKPLVGKQFVILRDAITKNVDSY